ncbi:hypothetical protein MYMAC_004842 [Corallococcus macrosporus DSM 14697]|uniref:DUF1634 domain-containing protein n=2 Tax=Corallococcus macrosporus TaxID=35 RepID=A0A250K0T9_9BACT|nr:hypothetical protein MYMAC_004842 [Corallococcus macrosporus DSM 14697]
MAEHPEVSEPEEERAARASISAATAEPEAIARNVAVTGGAASLAPPMDGAPLAQPDVGPAEQAQQHHRERAVVGDRWIARVLRVGAVVSGGMFVLSLGLEALPQSERVHVSIDLLRKGAASLLLVTPVARLAVAGTLLGLRGEWRYMAMAAGVLGLLALAVGTGIHA